MPRKRLKLTWVDDTGTPYHTAEVSPRVARSLIVAEKEWATLYIDHKPVPLGGLTWVAVSEAKRAVVVKLQAAKTGHEIVIDIA